MADVSSEQRIDWRMRNLEWLLPRVGPDREGQEQFTAMYEESLKQARYEGLLDAAEVVRRISAARPDLNALKVVATALENLAETDHKL